MSDQNKGSLYAISAFLLWGLSPIFYKALISASAVEIIAHRIVWSVLLMAGLLAYIKRFPVILSILCTPRLLWILVISGTAVSFNWLLYVWSVNNGHLLQASLGYYINPLVNVVLGVMFMKERHGRLQWLAVSLATLGVLNMVVVGGQVPWIALGLACSFGAYGAIRKIIPVGAMEGLFVETLLFFPFALVYLFWLDADGSGQFTTGWTMSGLLILSGAVTTIPLLLFTMAAKRLRLSTVGFLQFITPTGHFLLGVFLYGEAFSRTHLTTFVLIWMALALYSWASFKQRAGTGERK